MAPVQGEGALACNAKSRADPLGTGTKARKAVNPQKRAVGGCLPSAKTRCVEHSSVTGVEISFSEAVLGVWAGLTVFYTRALENKMTSGYCNVF